MSIRRLILETGLGTDLYGEDYTKAATRGVKNAIQNNSLILFRSLKLDIKKMIVKVTVAVSEPEKVDIEEVKMCLPHGQVTVKVIPGGLDIKDSKNEVNSVVASVAVEAFFDVNMVNLTK